MDKLYTPSFPKNIHTPSDKTIALIKQFAASYNPIEIQDLKTDFVSN